MHPAEKKRFLFIDFFRGFVILKVIEGHTFTALLLFSLRESSAYKALNFFDQITAPAFLFIAGVSFAISTRRKDEFKII